MNITLIITTRTHTYARMPEYRAVFRDRPFNTTKYYPGEDPRYLRNTDNKVLF